ncbi:aromatic amino acid transport family protein [Suttonella indologenes]|uniref:Aromatic amino acid permease n=1 Tax=Suttonella indologenes TaxID=13276 RepID=A0A380MYI3_9GAMM|nr:aromatic amino acid transport family protein [Suttonella indologenes]SUO97348.1 Tyrosine permease [Suttonella indologenes]
MNKTLGTTLLVSGTMIGAGMLAMPLTSAGIGFAATAVLLILIWAMLSYSALLFVEVYQTVPADAGIGTLSAKYFGRFGRIVSTAVMLIFLFALLAAYMTGGGSILATYLPPMGDAQTHKIVSVLLFTLLLGAVVVLGTLVIDGLNRLLFYSMLAVLVFVLIVMMPEVSMQNLSAMPLDKAFIISACPVFFTSFGFHGSIPSFNKYLNGDVKALRIAILAGTSITLSVYMLWQLGTHGVLTQAVFVEILKNDPTLGGMLSAVEEMTGSARIAKILQMFSVLALVTSFLGVALGLFETIEDMLQHGFGFKAKRLLLGVLTFALPLLFALFYPEGFIQALQYASQMFVFYAVVLPAALVWKARRQYPHLPYRLWGGNWLLWLIIVLGLLIVNVPFFIRAGYLPEVVV